MRRNIITARPGILVLFLSLFFLSSFLTRLILALYSRENISHSIFRLIYIFSRGLFFDSVVAGYLVVPVVIYLVVIPAGIFTSKPHRLFFGFAFYLIISVLLFGTVSEYIFWDEFGVRFNFIAVDYLVYSQEVLGNIWESYPVPLILTLLFTIAFFIFLYIRPCLREALFKKRPFPVRLRKGAVFLIVSMLPVALSNMFAFSRLSNSYEKGLAQNGIYQLFHAFWANELDYNSLYSVIDDDRALQKMSELNGFEKKFSGETLKGFTKSVPATGKEKKYNVVLVMVESLSARYLGVLGDKRGLTPNIDAIARKGLLFTNMYATGTRTVRGMEAVTLSIPPTPGRSIVKRPNNANLFSLGFLFRERGYVTQFLYGGYGYFDNMNEFFSKNGFTTVDRTNLASDEITFSNIWGVSDEDMLGRAIREFDKNYKSDKPFMGFIMTTSNHRPYTYPDGKIDIPSHTGRDGGVKYTDYAIGSFFEEASRHGWFKNTLFVIVADHCASSAGRAELPVHNYRIPLIFYAPEIVKPGINNLTASQVDVAPTILGILGWGYQSKFFGFDMLKKGFKQRAFVGNYQKLGLLKKRRLTVLSPKQTVREYRILEEGYSSSKVEPVPIPDGGLTEEAISYYQSAGYLYKNRLFQWDGR